MSSDRKETLNVNIGGLFSTLLAVAFIVLKLCNVIDWSWWWVLAPLWIPLALVIVIMLIVVIIAWVADRV
jgi:membrane protein YdbS with pleckstrin-like domain